MDGVWDGRKKAMYKRKVHVSDCSLWSYFKPNQYGGQLSAKENRARNRANQAALSNLVIPQKYVQLLFPGSTAGNSTAVI